jgi:hypothetical protein
MCLVAVCSMQHGPESCDLTGQEDHVPFWYLLVWREQRTWQQEERNFRGRHQEEENQRLRRRDSAPVEAACLSCSAVAGEGGCEPERGH